MKARPAVNGMALWVAMRRPAGWPYRAGRMCRVMPHFVAETEHARLHCRLGPRPVLPGTARPGGVATSGYRAFFTIRGCQSL